MRAARRTELRGVLNETIQTRPHCPRPHCPGEKMYYKYTNNEIEYLKKRDTVLGAEIEKIGMIKREVEPDLFKALIQSIISQQISTKAAGTVKNRLVELIGQITQENIANTDIESIQKCGMTLRKAKYIKDIANASIKGAIDFQNLNKLDDGQVIKELSKLKGVGEWTAEMLLIHSLQRPNILSYKDLGIRRGIMKLYKLENLSMKDFEIYRERYSPHCTLASLYLWKISEDNWGRV